MKPHKYIDNFFRHIDKTDQAEKAVFDLKKVIANDHEITVEEKAKIEKIYQLFAKKTSNINIIFFFIGIVLLGATILIINIYDSFKEMESLFSILTIVLSFLSVLILTISFILSICNYIKNKNKANRDFLLLELEIVVPLIIIIVILLII